MRNINVTEPWSAQMSKKNGCKYYFSMCKNNKPRSEYYIPTEAKLDMLGSYSNRVMWPWEPFAVAILSGEKHDGVTRAQLESYIEHNINR